MIITLVGAGEGVAGMVEAVVVELDERVRERLIRTAVSLKAQVRAVLRARIVLAAAEGLSNGAIARDLAVSVNTVRKWRGRFAALGRDGLKDAARSGRPKAYGPQVTVAIVAAATSAPPHPEATWSHRTIAAQVAGTAFATISASQVGRILADLDLKPHRVRGWLTRRDTPDFWDRVADVCDLYRDPPEGAVVLSIDEKTAIAARARRHPGRPAGPGEPAREEFEYRRHGTASLVAALDVRTGEVLTEIIARNDAATFTAFLDQLDTAIVPGQDIHVVLDNGSSHTAKHTKAWLADHPRWHVHWTPPHASWLNQIELFFSVLTRRVLRHGDFSSRDDLIDKLESYVIGRNETAKPYRWTYDGSPLKTA
ncbi:IS630 family transposase [Streptomyces sp. NBC_01643]|nr:IS630 family transposase [Streptomyces sp. NBC_01643]WTD33717.1 IS630 family transposase [Streptomyces sp. NBC_01643]WTD37014.1 IS630 family transposase [Streptomyces sp. NBC_01643]WTD37907.1 IS630 family transposase [Streptomyces sp. NBC_01643]WTD38563.1 IS630 family transposase [Streptomyces sp. NBC_01643]